MIINLVVNDATNFKRLNYVINQLLEHPFSPEGVKIEINSRARSNLKLNYGHTTEEHTEQYIIPKANCFFGEKKINNDHLSINGYSSKIEEVYAVENLKSKGLPFCENQYFGFDIFETLFFHWSRYEEWVYEGDKDYKGMMPEHRYLLVKYGFEKTPVVDLLIKAFWDALGMRDVEFSTKILLTHDIDHLRKFHENSDYLKKKLGQIKRGELKGFKVLKEQIKEHKENGTDPYDVYDWLLEKNKSQDGVIYYLVGGTTKYDSPIDLKDEIFTKSVALARERSYHIGIHPSYEASINPSLFKKELNALQSASDERIAHSRSHYLRFSWPESLDILEQEKIYEESSLAFAERVGFRCGTGFRYRLYHLEQDRESEVFETPLVFMDSAFLKEVKEQKGDINKEFLNFWEENKGRTQIVFNFHNNRFEESDRNKFGLRSLYDTIRKDA